MSFHLPRYLVPFDLQRIPHHYVDELVIGGGIAGLRESNGEGGVEPQVDFWPNLLLSHGVAAGHAVGEHGNWAAVATAAAKRSMGGLEPQKSVP